MMSKIDHKKLFLDSLLRGVVFEENSVFRER